MLERSILSTARTRIAWFRPTPVDPALDPTAALIAELAGSYAVDVVDERQAHDFVWRHFHSPPDLIVYELDNRSAYDYVWPYLVHYPGVLLLHASTVHDSRANHLARQRRVADYLAEFAFSHGASRAPRARHSLWPMLRVPLVASRAVVVTDEAAAATLRPHCAETRVHVVPSAVPVIGGRDSSRTRTGDETTLRVGTFDTSRVRVIEQAIARARAAGASVELVSGRPVEEILERCDLIVAIDWPVPRVPFAALLAFAAAKPVVVLEGEPTAAWPALDPQTWQPRGFAAAAPIAVSLDPRDEEHSLMLALRRLASDARLRTTLGSAGHTWWRTHATVAHAAAAWRQILDEAVAIPAPRRPADWPEHLTRDGTQSARGVLEAFGSPAAGMELIRQREGFEG